MRGNTSLVALTVIVLLFIVAFVLAIPELAEAPTTGNANTDVNTPSLVVCTTDADCAVAGCSQQVCTSAALAPDIITTCEYRAEYACLRQTSCGCQAGQCGWAQTDAYLACLDDIDAATETQ